MGKHLEDMNTDLSSLFLQVLEPKLGLAQISSPFCFYAHFIIRSFGRLRNRKQGEPRKRGKAPRDADRLENLQGFMADQSRRGGIGHIHGKAAREEKCTLFPKREPPSGEIS
jgi:hypothetical protein